MPLAPAQGSFPRLPGAARCGKSRPADALGGSGHAGARLSAVPGHFHLLASCRLSKSLPTAASSLQRCGQRARGVVISRPAVLVVTRLDRLARSTRDLLNVLDELAKRGAGFRSLKDAWGDTTTPHGKLMLTVLGGLAEFERELIRARTGEGRKRAQERGVRFGHPRKLTAHQRDEALQRLRQGETQADIARSYAVDPATISRLAAASPFEHGAAVAQ